MSLPPTSMTELVLILRECECAKNRFSNRSGFSPMQRMTGQWPRMPGSLMSDEELDPALQAENHTDDFSRLMEARRVAQQSPSSSTPVRPRLGKLYMRGQESS